MCINFYGFSEKQLQEKVKLLPVMLIQYVIRYCAAVEILFAD